MPSNLKPNVAAPRHTLLKGVSTSSRVLAITASVIWNARETQVQMSNTNDDDNF